MTIGIGAHPAVNFKPVTAIVNGETRELLVSNRYFAAELAPNYKLNKHISVGVYYLVSHGFDQGSIRYTHFLTLNSTFSNVKLSKNYFLKFTPQLYYLKMDRQDGYFFTSTLTLAHKNWPISVSGLINKRLKSDIAVSKDFVWNATLIYSFNKEYVRK